MNTNVVRTLLRSERGKDSVLYENRKYVLKMATFVPRSSKGVQCGSTKVFLDKSTETATLTGSYHRGKNADTESDFTTYEDFQRIVLQRDNLSLIEWCQEHGLIPTTKVCPDRSCGKLMKLCLATDSRKDGYLFRCRYRKPKPEQPHNVNRSIRNGTFFSEANLTIAEALTYCYWWCIGLAQHQIKAQMRLSDHTGVDWSMFYREVCCTILAKESERLGGPGKRVQIDETKVGKRKYHVGRMVDGTWVRHEFTIDLGKR